MPFTLAHPALVLPLRRTGLPMAALVAGSTVPDARLFVPWLGTYDHSHSLVGIVTIDLALALVLLAVWVWVVRDVLVDVAPDVVRERLEPRSRLSSTAWALAVPAAVIGSATHVGWDAFTHDDRWGTRHVTWLREEHWFWPGYTWAQAASGVVGLVIVGWASVVWVRARPREPRADPPLLPRSTLLAVGVLLTVTAVVAGADRLHRGVEPAAQHAVVTALQVGVLAVGVVCVAWWVLRGVRVARPSLRP
ncbi:DUF4184 family protein [Nocardioides plantarum]|uniref:DUF4184 family protein n=1 Tax=Nocardioides plantarum TaxID=29299 RepID=A0ABV5K896_9ACTN|nr:DUF4184 family protein [Nocardioides plantarum]